MSSKAENPRQKVAELIGSSGLCVLATHGQSGPHASLMSYVAEHDGERVYLATLAATRKFANLADNPAVSLLMDNRGELSGDDDGLAAVSVSGQADVVDDELRAEALGERFGQEHPRLAKLLSQPDCRIVEVRVRHFQLLEGVLGPRVLEVG